MYNFITAWDVIHELRNHGTVIMEYQTLEDPQCFTITLKHNDPSKNLVVRGPTFEDTATTIANRLQSGDIPL